MSRIKDHRKEQLDFSHVQSAHRPILGRSRPLTEDELYSKTEELSRTHCGTFDTSDPQQSISGSTLAQIYDRNFAGLTRIVYVDYRWNASDGDSPPVMFVFILWQDLYVADKQRHREEIHGLYQQPVTPSDRRA